MRVRVIGPRDHRPPDAIDTTSRSRSWSRGLSPFFLGPVPLYSGAPIASATNVENAWQYSKVYSGHDRDGQPTPQYFEWAREGWKNPRAVRYPMGKGAKPLYSWWGKRLNYIEARRKIYLPLYIGAVLGSSAWVQLVSLYTTVEEVTLWDFDGYDFKSLGMSFHDAVHCETRKMGHAIVLAGLLELKHGLGRPNVLDKKSL